MNSRKSYILVGALLLAAGIVVLALLVYPRTPAVKPADNAETAASPEAERAMTIAVEFGDQRRDELSGIPWRDGISVIELLQTAAGSNPNFEFQHRGDGETVFVESIGGLRNSGEGRNWLFYINGKKCEVGAGAYRLQPGDVVLWKYTDEK